MVPIIKIMPVPMTIVTVPITPVSSHGGAGYCADSCASAATYNAANDCTAQSRLRKCIRHRYRYSQPEQGYRNCYAT